MSNPFLTSTYFGVILSIIAFYLGTVLKKKFKYAIFNPLLVAIALVIAFLAITGIDYEAYNQGAKYISYFLTPTTVCLAIPLYQQLDMLKKNPKAILIGIVCGVIASLGSIFALSALFGLNHEVYVSLLPKSITTAIGIGLSAELGGITTLTVVVIVVTGVLGNILAETVLKIFRITEPVAKGLAIGTASHAVGTAKALEIGEIEGAMSSLSIAVSGLLTVAVASFFAMLI